MKQWLLIFALAFLVGLPAAQADVYNFDYNGTGVNASGTITVTHISGIQWQITGITGQRNGQAITGGLQTSPLADGTLLDDLISFAPPSPISPATFSSIPATGWSSGFAFQTTDGIFQPYTWSGGDYTPYGPYAAGEYEYTLGTFYNPPFANVPITFDVSAVPEPGFYGVLALGLSGLFVGVRRRRA